jgi:hypothetical protein
MNKRSAFVVVDRSKEFDTFVVFRANWKEQSRLSKCKGAPVDSRDVPKPR